MDDESAPVADRPRSNESARRWRQLFRSKFALEVIALLVLAAVSSTSAWSVLRTYGESNDSRFNMFIANNTSAIMLAAGKGMRHVAPEDIPELHEFVNRQTPAFDVEQIPADFHGEELKSSYSLMHYHLLTALGLTWRVLGVSRASANVFALMMFCAFMLSVYALLRLTGGPIISSVVACWLSLSPVLLIAMPSVRDFSKAPFLFAGLALLGWLVTKPRPTWQLPLLAIATGILAGVGFGFRQDVGMLVPLALVAFVAIVPPMGPRPWLSRLASAAALMLAFAFAGYQPIRGTMADNGSASAQAFVQGVSDQAERRMGVGGASYVHHYHYSDLYDWVVVNSFARRAGIDMVMPFHFTPGHGLVGQILVRQYYLHHPRDMITRALAAAILLPHIHEALQEDTTVGGIRTPEEAAAVLHSRMPLHGWFLATLPYLGWPLLLVAVSLVFMWRPRLGFLIGLALAYFGAYPSLLYEYRHYAHLGVIPYWALATVAGLAPGTIRRMLQEPSQRPLAVRRAAMGLALACGILLAVVCITGVAGAVQSYQMNQTYEQFRSLELEQLGYQETKTDQGVLLHPNTPLPQLAHIETMPAGETAGEYLALEFEGLQQVPRVGLIFRQDYLPQKAGLQSQTIIVPAWDTSITGTVTLFLPVYAATWGGLNDPSQGISEVHGTNNFHGIYLEHEDAAKLRGFYRVRDSYDIERWPFLSIPDDPAAFLGHKRMQDLGKPYLARDPSVRPFEWPERND